MTTARFSGMYGCRHLHGRDALTWALRGSFKWNSLVTRVEGYYEAGTFEVDRPGPPRPAPLAVMLRDLMAQGCHNAPELRFFYPPVSLNSSLAYL